jgi:hypothetical protein
MLKIDDKVCRNEKEIGKSIYNLERRRGEVAGKGGWEAAA